MTSISSHPHTKTNLIITIFLIVIITLTYSLMSWWTPMALDDYVFKSAYLNHNNLSDHFNLHAYVRYINEVRNADNSRIANLIAPFSSTFYPWKEIFPISTGLCVAAIIYFCIRFVIGKDLSKYPLSIAIGWVAIILFLPWRNNLFVADYALNYIYGAALYLLFITLALKSHSPHHSQWAGIALMAMAIPTGMWHEGFALPTLFGFIIITLRHPKRPWWWWGAGGMMAAGAIFAIYCPGTISRIEAQAEPGFHFSASFAVDYAGAILLSILICASAMCKMGRKCLLQCLNNEKFILFFSITFSGLSLSFLLPHSPRMAFYPDICALICTGIFIRSLINQSYTLRSKFKKSYIPCCMTALALTLTQSSISLIWQHNLYEEDKEIIPLLYKSPTHTIYYNYIEPYDIPAYTLYFPTKGMWQTAYHYQALGGYMQTIGIIKNENEYPAVVTQDLRNAQAGTYSHGLVTDTPVTPTPCVVDLYGEIEYKSGKRIVAEATKCLALPFSTSDGNRLILIHPLGKGNNTIKNIKADQIIPL